ncbi:septal ring lytic transglycosylase RlpA family protein [Massilia sp. ST3]|uniref:septal ring lytic transglycosylase RlpA family protein n=1 Tax=Massilia sp. ST3 TaxID=2824903 RepID=UPI001B822BEE|nr:septal ring lytic transglycosylase RlpA family protein [Massilia sp. ST3]MBQ5950495.1 septal ring lytic transglycosylase RlpA family protein [Massilia sp. ST3]
MAVRRIYSAALAVALLAAGCTTKPGGEHRSLIQLIPLPWLHKPALKHGEAPALPAAESSLGGYHKDSGQDAQAQDEAPVVKYEPYARWGNRPYSVLGQTYTPILHEDPFVQRGMASWYANRFHGQKTTSGEPYDKNKMTAAHPTLPIPSYARVTSVDSGKSVIVRINDRGPFHASRVIDVSYTAALKLGLLDRGSHQVKVERLFPDDPSRIAAVRRAAASQAQSAAPEIAAMELEDGVRSDSAALAQATPGFYVQLGAYSRAGAAEAMSAKLAKAGVALGTLEVAPAGASQRLYGGPFATRAEAVKAARKVPKSFGLKPLVVKR